MARVFLLVLVMLLLRQAEEAAHPLHLLCERANGFTNRVLLEIAEDLVPILDRGDAAKRCVEELREVVLVATSRDRRHNLVEVQVGEKGRLRRACDVNLVTVEEDALEDLGCRRDARAIGVDRQGRR